MNRQNIISAGKMIAIVVALLGAMYCGATLAPLVVGIEGIDGRGVLQPGMFGVATLWNLLFGAALLVCGLVMTTTFGRTESHPALATLILVTGSLTAILGLVAVALVYLNPFSWMTAIVGTAVFIDALCLKISLSRDNK